MKKTLSIVLAGTMALAMTACGGSGSTTSSAAPAAESTKAESTAAPAESTAAQAETEAAPAESTAAPAESTAAESTPAEGEVMSYADYIAADMDSPVVVETYVQAKQSWWEDKATLYTQDEDGAYFVYNAACSEEDYEKLVEGQKIRVTGYKTEWSGEVEIADATIEILDGSFVAEPLDVTAMLGTDELIAHQNELVSFKGMTVEPIKDADGNEAAFLYNWDGSGEDGSDLYFNVSVNGQTYNFTVESYLCDATTEVYNAVKALEIGDVIDLEGFLYWYEGPNPHITYIQPAE